MLKFQVFDIERPAMELTLAPAHLVGADDIGVRSSIDWDEGLIVCEKSAMGAAALAVQVEMEELGQVVLQTCLLPERERPYILSLELARHRLMRCLCKQEEWAMFELPADGSLSRGLAEAHEKFIEALSSTDEPETADRLGREALAAAVVASEELATAHAEALLRRRRRAGHLARHVFGCGVQLDQTDDHAAATFPESFDFLSLPTPWRRLEPREQENDWSVLDGWCEWAMRQSLPVVAGPLAAFSPDAVPDWLYIWEHDYDTVRDFLYEHMERVVGRYRGVVKAWNVVSGVHVNDHFTLNFEQIMDMTRMAVMLVRKAHPQARTIIEIDQPFGEYYARNPRSIPPLMYAEMILQAGIDFDAFGLRVLMGDAQEGRRTRDLMQLSALLDRFYALGKPVRLTAVAAPSQPIESAAEAEKPQAPGGYWHRPWSEEGQAQWLEAVANVALSKPCVDSLAWAQLADHEEGMMPAAGLLRSDFSAKAGFERFAELRRSHYEQRAATAVR